MAVQNPPAGYAGATPYLCVNDADAAIAWYQQVLGAELAWRMEWQGKVGHAEMKISGGHFMLADEFEGMNKSPGTLGGTSVQMLVYVADADVTHARALAAGAKQTKPVETQPWGDRMGGFTDPFGHGWSVATHVEDVAPDEVARRMKAAGH